MHRTHAGGDYQSDLVRTQLALPTEVTIKLSKS